MSEGYAPVRALLGKELRQLRRSRGVLASSTLFPILFLVVAPLSQLLALSGEPAAGEGMNGVPLPGLADVTEPVQLFLRFLFPLFMTLGGLIVPSLGATYTVVAERERRSLELLMALPVSVGHILVAKLLATLTLAGGVVLPLFALDAVLLLVLGVATPLYLGMMLLILLSALTCAVALALLLALLARDFRTANNVNGVLIGPLMVAMMGTLAAVPGEARYLAVAALLLLVAGLALLVARRWLTFERYLA